MNNTEKASSSKTTHFGFEQVPIEEKSAKVGAIFSSVAGKYDLMNDLMSAGMHRIWKRFAISQSGVKPGDRVLDLAAGSGDLTAHFHRQVGSAGEVIMTDINAEMLAEGKAKMRDSGIVNNIGYQLMDAEDLQFDDNSFNCVSISFGLRNVTRKEVALKEMYRVLKPGGRALILEFSKPVLPLLQKGYDLYSFNVIPKIGKLVADDEASYQYLVESIRMHPDQEALMAMMKTAGFDAVKYHNLTAGVVALHLGFKY